MAAPDPESSARLIERLVEDAGFRERFRSDPVAAFHEAGVRGPPEVLAKTAGKAMETLEMRESRSSLAGVAVASAIELLSVYELAGGGGVAYAAELPPNGGGHHEA